MLSFAGYGVATGNAAPSVKELADEVIGTNEEQAVLSYLEGLLDALDVRDASSISRRPLTKVWCLRGVALCETMPCSERTEA